MYARLQTISAFTSQNVLLCDKQVLESCPPRTVLPPPPTPWPISTSLLFSHDLTTLDITAPLTFTEWSHLVHRLRHMPLRRLTAALPLAKQRRSAVAARADPRFAHVPGRSHAGAPVQVTDLEVLSNIASAGELPHLRHLGLVESALHEVCMPSLTLLFESLAETLTSLDLYEADPVSTRHLSGFEAAMRQTHGHRSAAPWDCFMCLNRLRVLAVGRQTPAAMRAFAESAAAVPALPGLDALEVVVIDASGERDEKRGERVCLRDAETLEAYTQRALTGPHVGVFFVEKKPASE